VQRYGKKLELANFFAKKFMEIVIFCIFAGKNKDYERKTRYIFDFWSTVFSGFVAWSGTEEPQPGGWYAAGHIQSAV
jgi:hypothetical protein